MLLCYEESYVFSKRYIFSSIHVGKAKGAEHKIKTSLLEYDEIRHFYKDEDGKYKTIYLNETMENVKANLPTYFNCVCIYSRTIHNINDVFEQFVSTFNTVPIITNVINLIF